MGVGSYFPDQELNPGLLHWKHGVLTTGPPQGSPKALIFRVILGWLQNLGEGTEISHLTTIPTMHCFPYQNGMCFTVDEPTLTHHCHPKSIVYMRVHFQCCTFYGFGQMYNDMYLAILDHTQYFQCPYGRKWRRTKEPLDESERGEWKSWLKA